MTVDASPSLTDPLADSVGKPQTQPWQRVLPWLGVPLCIWGLASTGILAQWRPGRFADLIVLALASLAVAALLRRLLRWRMATALALVWLAALVAFAGALPSAATLLLALATWAIGDALDRNAPLALRIAAGLTLCGGLLGWLLPLALHYRPVYLVAALTLVAWRWRRLRDTGRELARSWQHAIDPAPRVAAFAVLALGLASTACWLPTLQADDVVYHLRLPWQLLEAHRYPLDPSLHIWSLAPWLGDVLQAVPQVIAGAEARGPLNLLWIALAAAGVWRVAVALQGNARSAWLAVALYASLPLTAALAGGMQTETPTAALLVWLAWSVLDRDAAGLRRLWLGALLLGGLFALKLAAAASGLLLLAWVGWRHRHDRPSLLTIAMAACATLAIASSSYVYAAVTAHNPFLPLFNAWFQSPYFDAVNFDDPRWHAGVDMALPWNLTFHTERYLEAFAGGGGFVLVALAGAWVLALSNRRTASLTIVATLLLLAPMLPMQYLRYAFPAIVVLLPALVVAASRVDPRRAAWLITAVCVLNLAFQANSFWLLRVGAVKATVLAAGRDAPVFDEWVPERSLIAALRPTAWGQVLALDPGRPYVAEMGLRGRSVSYYDRSLQRAATLADGKADGSDWAALFHREGISDVLLRPSVATPAQRAGLLQAGARRERVQGDIEWWRIPQERTP
ncbi:hypothetical protein [Lysobacter terrae]